jgi:adenylyl-sulfate kinase
MTVWLTGLPAAGKTTIGDALGARLTEAGLRIYRLDGDVLRVGLCSDLGFSDTDRHENLRRAGHIAVMLAHTGTIVIASLISPYTADRTLVRLHDEQGFDFIEVFVDTPLTECQRRDPRGLYARAERDEVSHVTGVDDPYEPPTDAEVHVHPAAETIEESTEKVWQAVAARLSTLSR